MSYTRVLMTTSAIYLGALGFVATFAADVVLDWLRAPSDLMVVVQVVGALYLGFAVLNWMARENLIVGIYSRPVAIGNLMHFLVAALAILKTMASSFSHAILWGIAAPYAGFAIAFGLILFRHPVGAAAKVGATPISRA